MIMVLFLCVCRDSDCWHSIDGNGFAAEQPLDSSVVIKATKQIAVCLTTIFEFGEKQLIFWTMCDRNTDHK